MAKSERIELRVTPDLKARVEALAAERGQTLTVFAERALEAALGHQAGTPGQRPEMATGPLGGMRSTPAPAPPPAPAAAFNRVRTLKR